MLGVEVAATAGTLGLGGVGLIETGKLGVGGGVGRIDGTVGVGRGLSSGSGVAVARTGGKLAVRREGVGIGLINAAPASSCAARMFEVRNSRHPQPAAASSKGNLSAARRPAPDIPPVASCGRIPNAFVSHRGIVPAANHAPQRMNCLSEWIANQPYRLGN